MQNIRGANLASCEDDALFSRLGCDPIEPVSVITQVHYGCLFGQKTVIANQVISRAFGVCNKLAREFRGIPQKSPFHLVCPAKPGWGGQGSHVMDGDDRRDQTPWTRVERGRKNQVSACVQGCKGQSAERPKARML